MRIRRVTIEVEVPWDAEYETALLNVPLDGNGLLRALQRGISSLYDDDEPPHQEQVIKEELSLNTCIGDVTEWSAK